MVRMICSARLSGFKARMFGRRLTVRTTHNLSSFFWVPATPLSRGLFKLKDVNHQQPLAQVPL